MITFIKKILRYFFVPSIYFGAIGTFLLTIFKNAKYSLYLLSFIIPQPNIYYKLHQYPYGNMLIDLALLSLIMGIVYQGISQNKKTGNEKWIIILILYSYFAIWNSSRTFNLPAPLFTESPLFVSWKNFVRVLLLYFIVVRIVTTEREIKKIILIMGVAIFLISLRAYRNFSGGAAFSWDKRYGGPFEACGLGANHFGAFIAAYTLVYLTIYFYDKNFRRKIFFLITALISLHPLLFSYSRGAYLGYFCGLLPLGVIKSKKIIVVQILVIIAWKMVLPVSVIDRIEMTEDSSGQLESSAAERIELWKDAYTLFGMNPIFGVGYNGFTIYEKRSEDKIISGGGQLTDTHNYYLRILCEQGIVGVFIFLMILYKAFRSGMLLCRNGKTNFLKGLGLGFIGCVFSLAVSNMFGDRFSYIVSGAYFWILFALVDSALINMENMGVETGDDKKEKKSRGIINQFLEN